MCEKEERKVVCSKRREAQQKVKCWGCGEARHVQRKQHAQGRKKYSKRK